MIIKYDRETYKILGYYTGNIKDIKLKENENIKELNIQDCSQKDIRAYNEDGSCKSLKQQIEEKILILKDNEIIKDNIVVELNKNNSDDYIELVKRGLEKLDDDKKIAYDDVNKREYITEKTLEEKLIDNVLTVEEFITQTNQEVIQKRTYEYTQKLDGKRAELLEAFLLRMQQENKLTESESCILNELITERAKIKENYSKTTEKEVLLLKNKSLREIDNGKRKIK